MNTKHRISDEMVGLLLISAITLGSIILLSLEIKKTQSVARAYYYKYTLETSENRYMPQIEDAQVIKYLDIKNRKQLENDIKNLQENYR
jgi:hypothetical protein